MDARVLIVADTDDVLDGLSAWLGHCPGFEAAGVAHSVSEAYERIELQAPDIVLMALSMPGINGLDATRLIKTRPQAPLVILMTPHDYEPVRQIAVGAGADACLSMARLIEEFPSVAGALWRARKARRTTAEVVAAIRPREVKS